MNPSDNMDLGWNLMVRKCLLKKNIFLNNYACQIEHICGHIDPLLCDLHSKESS